MDYSLLRSWLGLAPGPWPPDHYALIGLPPSAPEPREVERIVLERMARLRTHQLRHPELVTEGMNRLAQALVCLTDPTSKAAYDAEIGLPPPLPALPASNGNEVVAPARPPTMEATIDGIPGFPIPTEPELPAADPTQIIEVRFTPGLAPPELPQLPYEVVESPPPLPAALPYEIVPEEPEPPLIALPRPAWQPVNRRQLYARLAALRRLRAAWLRMKPHLADPREPLDRPVRVLTFLEAVLELRMAIDLVPDLIGEPWRAGGRVSAVVRQPLVLDAIHVLLPDQRRALAADWREGDAVLEEEYNRLRELSRSGRKRRPFRRRNKLIRGLLWCLRHPESVLVGLALAAIAAALVRTSIIR